MPNSIVEVRTGKSPGPSKHRFSPHAKLHSPLPIRSFEAPIAPRCKILNEHHRSASKASVSIYQSINRPISTSNPTLAKQLPAVTRSQHLQRPNPQGTAVTASRSHSPIKRIEPYWPVHRSHIVPPADRIASRSEPYRIPVPRNRKPPFSHLASLCAHHHLQAHGTSLNQPITSESPPTISEPSPLCVKHPQFPFVSLTSNRYRHNIAPYSPSQPPLQAYPQVAFLCLSPYSGNSPFLLDHAASTSVACMVSNTPVPDRKGCPTAHRR